MTGIDISAVQGDSVPGTPWEFVTIKSSEGLHVPNYRIAAQWAWAAQFDRGLYHYASPFVSNGAVQSGYFASDALHRGFVHDVNHWQLDAENGQNEGFNDWGNWIDAFMQPTLSTLGARGFLYCGWPFVVQHGLQEHVKRYKWWLPDYGPNNGIDHGYPAVPAEFQKYVVIHQFCSMPGTLDRNTVVNRTAFSPAPPVKVKPMPGMPLDMLPWAAKWINPDGSVKAAAAANGDVYAFGVPYVLWSSQHTDLAGQPPVSRIGQAPGLPAGRYMLTLENGATYVPPGH
jgi:hypothetical protein